MRPTAVSVPRFAWPPCLAQPSSPLFFPFLGRFVYSPWLSGEGPGDKLKVHLSLTPALRALGSELVFVASSLGRLPMVNVSFFLFFILLPLILSLLFMLVCGSDEWLKGLDIYTRVPCSWVP